MLREYHTEKMPSIQHHLYRLVFTVAALSLFVQYRLIKDGVSPVALSLPDLPEFPAITSTQNDLTGKVEILGLNDLVGPECLVEATYKGKALLFLSLADGRIVRLTHNSDGSTEWDTVVRTGSIPHDDNTGICKGDPHDSSNKESVCGRPLGMKIVKRSTVDPIQRGKDNEDVLVVADATGLLMVDSIYENNTSSSILTLATRANTDDAKYSFRLLNAVVQKDEALYITETSRFIQRRRIFHAAFDGRPTGRLLKYTMSKGVEVLVDNLYMPNGITLSHDEQDLIIVAGVQILRYSLVDNKMHPNPFVDVMPGTGDNIEYFPFSPSGKKVNCYWAGLGSRFAQPFSLLKALSEKPLLKSILCALIPYKTIVELIPKLSALAVYGEDGRLIEVYQDSLVSAPWISEGKVLGNYLYLGSWYNPFLARVKLDHLK
jgi:sugar lactone lactonase YvrE